MTGESNLAARVERALGHAPLSQMDAQQRRELDAAVVDALTFEDLPGKWQAAVLQAESRGKGEPPACAESSPGPRPSG